MKKIALLITLDRPQFATEKEIIAYVEDAVKYWGGGLEPAHDSFDEQGNCEVCGSKCCGADRGDPMFGHHESVVVTKHLWGNK